jgi:3-methyl-2-oxobutanoate hydroxymethyltransferase
MTVYGMASTVGVTLEMMIAHGRAVAQAASHACIVVDLPVGSYEESPSLAFRSAARIMAETGCAAVKLEGGAFMAESAAPYRRTRALEPQPSGSGSWRRASK